MDDAYFEELDQQDLERIEEDNDLERIEEDNNAPVGPDEAEEAVVTTRDVKPKRVVVKPRLKLDDKRLKGPRGLSVLEPLFKNVVLRGPGYERRDLDTVMSLLEHWAHRLFPKMTFDDCLEKIEELGHKKSVSAYLTQLRMGCADPPSEPQRDDVPVRSRSPSPQPTVDPFDQLLDRSPQSQLTDEQRERMERNKLVALERRRARLKAKYEKPNNTVEESHSANIQIETASSSQLTDSTPSTNDNSKLDDLTSMESVLDANMHLSQSRENASVDLAPQSNNTDTEMLVDFSENECLNTDNTSAMSPNDAINVNNLDDGASSINIEQTLP